MVEYLRKERWYFLSVCYTAGLYLLGWYLWRWFDPEAVIWKSPREMGLAFVLLHMIREISKLKHPEA